VSGGEVYGEVGHRGYCLRENVCEDRASQLPGTAPRPETKTGREIPAGSMYEQWCELQEFEAALRPR
jgi:hypothetical protein